jgi:hypothetical protein
VATVVEGAARPAPAAIPRRRRLRGSRGDEAVSRFAIGWLPDGRPLGRVEPGSISTIDAATGVETPDLERSARHRSRLSVLLALITSV